MCCLVSEGQRESLRPGQCHSSSGHIGQLRCSAELWWAENKRDHVKHFDQYCGE